MRPTELRYTEAHEWAKADGDICTVGITDFAVEQLTDLVYLELPSVGATVEKGGAFGEIESVKAVSDLHSPVSGTVEEVNSDLPDSLEKLSESPFEEGWMVKIKMSDPGQIESLMTAEAYEKLVEEESA
jgi:glycine cleavage system H protein